MSNPASDFGARPLAQGVAHVLTSLARRRGAPQVALDALEAAIAAVVGAAGDGQVCVPLETVCEPGSGAPMAADPAALGRLRTHLFDSGMVCAPEAPGPAGDPAPLVLDDAGRLYLYRYYQYEVRLAAALTRRAARPDFPIDAEQAGPAISAGFAGSAAPAGEPDLQKVAVAQALLRPLTVISGGPGTGKTSTVLALLTALLKLAPELRIALAAPTGKAAARLLESLRGGADRSGLSGLPAQAFTIHRLLRPIPGTTRFRHDREHPLTVDVLVVDEASMLDLALATKLIEALPDHARLILLGDRHQLAAVEAGSVFHDLAATPGLSEAMAARVARLLAVAGTLSTDLPLLAGAGPLADTTIWLRRNYRFGGDSAIGRAAALLRGTGAGEARTGMETGEALLDLVRQPDSPVRLIEATGENLNDAEFATLANGYQDYLQTVAGLATRTAQPGHDSTMAAADLLKAFDAFRVLTVLRQGERGVERVNALLTRHALRHLGRSLHPGNPWFAGRPVMILANDHGLRLYNGDIGIAMPDAAGRMLVWFPGTGEGAAVPPRAVAAARLPRHETAFACTVHKAQGSEFDTVAVVLPGHANPLADRAMIYTALTRARRGAQICGSAALLVQAARQQATHISGLPDRLAEAMHRRR